jgi:hypothetical protein
MNSHNLSQFLWTLLFYGSVHLYKGIRYKMYGHSNRFAPVVFVRRAVLFRSHDQPSSATPPMATDRNCLRKSIHSGLPQGKEAKIRTGAKSYALSSTSRGSSTRSFGPSMTQRVAGQYGWVPEHHSRIQSFQMLCYFTGARIAQAGWQKVRVPGGAGNFSLHHRV